MKCRRNGAWAFGIGLGLMLMVGCTGNNNSHENNAVVDSVVVEKINTAPVQKGKDCTLYGKSGDFGMSTFTLVTDQGKEYEVTRVSEDGKEGKIYGRLVRGARYAMLLDNTGEALIFLINLDDLEKFVKDYYIYNGMLVLVSDGNKDWVEIQKLNAEEFIAVGKSGKKYTYNK